jgi:hypothetical protein
VYPGEFSNRSGMGSENCVGNEGYTRDPTGSHAIKRFGKLGLILYLDDLQVYAKFAGHIIRVLP